MTAGMQSGLRYRLRRALRHMEAQHRYLGPIQRELRQAVHEGSKDTILDWLARYRDALEAHFALEDGTIFPAIRGLAARTESEVVALVGEHEHLVAWLGALRERLATGIAGPQALEEFALALREHERREERLMASVVDASDAADAEG